MNNEFQIKENGFDEIKKSIIIKSLPITLVSLTTGYLIYHFNPNRQPNNVNILPFFIPIVLGAVIFGLYRGIKRQRILFKSYTLIINENEIIREQISTPKISIPHNEIQSIQRNPNGTLIILGKTTTETIIIPSQIDHSEQLDNLLSKIHPISDSDKKSLAEKFKGLIILSTLALMASVYISTNSLVVGITGTLVTLILVYSFYKNITNKNIDKKTKNGMWFVLLVLFSIIYTMYYKLSGQI